VRAMPLADVKERLPQMLRDAEHEPIVILRHGLPAGVLIGFASVAEWLEYRREHDVEFRRLVEKAAGLVTPPNSHR
jgi:PHD/YefM family antitoxin component YafN of YafNO toxin-antitoxin module